MHTFFCNRVYKVAYVTYYAFEMYPFSLICKMQHGVVLKLALFWHRSADPVIIHHSYIEAIVFFLLGNSPLRPPSKVQNVFV